MRDEKRYFLHFIKKNLGGEPLSTHNENNGKYDKVEGKNLKEIYITQQYKSKLTSSCIFSINHIVRDNYP